MVFFIIYWVFCNWLMIIFPFLCLCLASSFLFPPPFQHHPAIPLFFYRHLYKVNKNPMEFECLTEMFTSLVWYVTTLEYCQATIHHLNTLRQQRKKSWQFSNLIMWFQVGFFFISTIETNLCCVYLWLLNSKLSHFINF